MIWIYMGPEDRKPPFPEFPYTDRGVRRRTSTSPATRSTATGCRAKRVTTTHRTVGSCTRRSVPTVTSPARCSAGASLASSRTRRSSRSWRSRTRRSASSYADARCELDDDKMVGQCLAHDPAVLPERRALCRRACSTRTSVSRSTTSTRTTSGSAGLGAASPRRSSTTSSTAASSSRSMSPARTSPKQRKDNDYGHDPVLQRQFNFSGVVPFPTQDLMMIEHQWGAIADRTQSTSLPRTARSSASVDGS